jgi:hypothetical protein
VLRAPGLSPLLLFALVKLTEGVFHLRPRALARLVRGADARVRRILRASLVVGARVVVAETVEFARDTRFVAPGTLRRLPGAPEGRRAA